jgi:hypothetical protein
MKVRQRLYSRFSLSLSMGMFLLSRAVGKIGRNGMDQIVTVDLRRRKV